MADKSQQTEKPTPRRLEKAREQGQYPVSREFVAGMQFLAFVAVMGAFSRQWLAGLVEASRFVLNLAFHTEMTPAILFELIQLLTARVALPLLVAGSGLAAVSLLVHLAVTQLGVSLEKLSPDFTRLSPLKRISELPAQNLPQLFQALFLLPIFGYALFVVSNRNLPLFLSLPFQSIDAGLRVVSASIEDLLWKAAGALFVWGAIDLARQRRKWSQSMRMSKQEIRDESKESEGNPQIKSQIRRLQNALRRRQMMKEVPTATAVIVNPTHYAVAIRYRMESMSAPVVVALGKNYVALRIRMKAIESMVPIIENPPLAQGLYKSVDVGQEIPASFYRANAEILAYIYKLTNARRAN
ncbi:MAG: EscU/YscU/HrcU family type III secretion system export apparatus switch protein [Bryobacteraceae bacterium]